MELVNSKDKDRLPSSGYIVKLLHLCLTHFVTWMAKPKKIHSTLTCWRATWKHSNHVCIQPDFKNPCLCFLLVPQSSSACPKAKRDWTESTIFVRCPYFYWHHTNIQMHIVSVWQLEGVKHTQRSKIDKIEERKHWIQISWHMSKGTT